MIHIRVDDDPENSKRKFACGVGPELPQGDTYFFYTDVRAERADCQGCNPGGPRPFGIPLSELSGQPGKHGFGRFCEIARSWGHD